DRASQRGQARAIGVVIAEAVPHRVLRRGNDVRGCGEIGVAKAEGDHVRQGLGELEQLVAFVYCVLGRDDHGRNRHREPLSCADCNCRTSGESRAIASAIAGTGWTIEKRRKPSPPGPNRSPGSVRTPAWRRKRSAHASEESPVPRISAKE